MISVYDQWTVADCSVWEKIGASGIAQPPQINPHRPILHPQSFVLCVSFLCILMFSDLHSYLFIYLFFFLGCLHPSPPPALFSPLLFLPLTPSVFLTIHISLIPPFYVTLVAVSYRNRSSEKPPVTLRSQIAMNVCVCHTLSSSPAQQRPHRIYVPSLPEPF